MYIFARLLIAHLLSDIPLNLFAAEKRNGSFPYRFFVLGLHTTIVFLSTLILFVDRLAPTVVICALVVAVAHFLIDALRLTVERRVYGESCANTGHSKKKDLLRLFGFIKDPAASWSENGFRKWFLLNVFDQSLHILVLVLATSYLVRVL